MGLLKGGWNAVDGLSLLSMGPAAFFTPDYLHADISSQEVSGAATFEGVTALLPLSRLGRAGSVADGIVYLREDLNGNVLPYGGQAQSEARFLKV
jgi:hypothetical protein